MFKFIHFGCWNNMNNYLATEKKPVFSNIVDSINNKVDKSKNKYSTLFVAGDNYYQIKKPLKFSTNDLVKGFDLLSNININKKHILWGNHDVLYLSNEKHNGDMKKDDIIRKQIKYIKQSSDMEYNELKPNKIEPLYHVYKKDISTLFIMIDTSLIRNYGNESIGMEKGMPYYIKEKQVYKDYKGKKHQIKHTEHFKIYTLQRLDMLINKVKNEDIKNIIVIGHHPIKFFRTKIVNNKPLEKFLPFQEKGLITFFERMIDKLNYNLVNSNYNMYYLCADLHLYQQGTLLINNKKIEQYICGTGGTILDNLTKEDIINNNSEHYYCNEFYVGYGYLDCYITKTGKVNFKFIPLNKKDKTIILNKKTGKTLKKLYTIKQSVNNTKKNK